MAKRALGSGLSDLFGDVSAVYGKNYEDFSGGIQQIPINTITPNPMQPRRDFDERSLRELAASIEEHGLLQPIVVREDGHGGYVLIAGERRLRASKILKIEQIQALVMSVEDYKMRELALIENIQRSSLNPIELAHCYQALLQEHDLTQEQLASRIHKSRTQITNTIRLLELSQNAQELLQEGKITQGHAKMLIGLSPEDEQLALNTILGQKLNVRETELLAQNMKTKNKKAAPSIDSDQLESLQVLQEILKEYRITSSIKNNRITLQCDSESLLESVIQKLR